MKKENYIRLQNIRLMISNKCLELRKEYLILILNKRRITKRVNTTREITIGVCKYAVKLFNTDLKDLLWTRRIFIITKSFFPSLIKRIKQAWLINDLFDWVRFYKLDPDSHIKDGSATEIMKYLGDRVYSEDMVDIPDARFRMIVDEAIVKFSERRYDE